MGGYAFARMKFGGKSVLFGFVLAILMVPGQSYLIGQYEIIRELGLLETPWGIVLPGFFSAFGVFLMRQSFMSLPAELYLQTIHALFRDDALPRGCMRWRGIPVDLVTIRDTALMTVEAGRDDISGQGQTRVAHDLCSQIPRGRRRHHEEPDVGHLGMFYGRRWRGSVLPRLRRFIRDNAGRGAD
jgi:hypothetical protein